MAGEMVECEVWIFKVKGRFVVRGVEFWGCWVGVDGLFFLLVMAL